MIAMPLDKEPSKGEDYDELWVDEGEPVSIDKNPFPSLNLKTLLMMTL